RSHTRNRDGSINDQEAVLFNRYQSSTGLLVATAGSSTFVSDDGYGNITSGTVRQTYEIIRNQARLIRTISVSDTLNLNKSTSHSVSEVDYVFDPITGKMTGASGRSTLL